METIDEREIQKTTKEKQKKAERSNGTRSYSERVRAKWFCCAFKLVGGVIKRCLDYGFSGSQGQLKDGSDVHYFKLPCIGNLSHHIKDGLSELCKEFWKKILVLS